MEIN
jgi:hypothetical protein